MPEFFVARDTPGRTCLCYVPL